MSLVHSSVLRVIMFFFCKSFAVVNGFRKEQTLSVLSEEIYFLPHVDSFHVTFYAANVVMMLIKLAKV